MTTDPGSAQTPKPDGPPGMALLIAAVGGGVVVGIAGVARVTPLRMNARRTRRGASRV